MKTPMWLMTAVIVLGVLGGFQTAGAATDSGSSVLSLSPFAGRAWWDQGFELEDSWFLGGRLGLHFLDRFALEGTLAYSAPDHPDGGSVDLAHYGVDLVVDLLPGARFNPYLAGGWAQLNHTPDGTSLTAELNGVEAGAGLKIRLRGDGAEHTSLRLDVRDVMSDLTPDFTNDGETTHHWIASAGLQFAFGCVGKDSDGDGVRDRGDACPDTPTGAVVDERGCPLDGDGDGVLDGLDACPETPAGATVDAAGCPRDSDGDGVLDGLDRCPGTPAGATVDAAGCPLDSDGDGVYDGLDRCPDTPSNLQVDVQGCPIAVTTTEIELLDTGRISTSLIVFKSGSAELAPASIEILDEIGETLVNWPALRMEIGGHTDDSGRAEPNRLLSERRAQAVLDHLTARFPGLDAANYEVKGYGEAEPVAGNDTPEGRALNRRVEFKVLNAEDLKKEIESRKLLER